MKNAQRPLWLASVLLVSASAFVACQGLDSRKVTRGPDEPVGGNDGSGNTGNTGNTGNKPGSGGSDAMGEGGKDTGNPFGGETFTGGAPPVVDGPPEVLKVDPADGANDAEPTGSISLLFSEGLDEATVTPDSVTLMDGTTAVQGDVSYSKLVGTFNPAGRLSLLATYDVNATQAITDAGGQKLKAPFTSKFTVRDGVWGAEKEVEPKDTFGDSQDVGVDAQGNALLAWTRTSTDGMTYRRTVYARWINIASGAGDEVMLEDGGLDCLDVMVSVAPDGNALVSWRSYDADGNAWVRARRFVNGEWEAKAQTLNSQKGESATVVSNIGGGQGVVAWVREISDAMPPYSRYYYMEYAVAPLGAAWPADADTPYSAVSTSPNYDQISAPRAVLDAKGNALVMFNYYSGATPMPTYGDGVYYSRKALGKQGEYAVKINGSRSIAGGLSLVSDGVDGAMAIWGHITDPQQYKYVMRAARYSKAKQFAEGTVDISDPDLTEGLSLSGHHNLASNGTSFFATWAQQVGNSTNVYATHYDIQTAKWDALPTLMNDGNSRAGVNPSVGVDAHGNAIVAFEQEGMPGLFQILPARYVASSNKWSTGEPLTDAMYNLGLPQLAVGGNGVAAVLYGRISQRGAIRSPVGGLYRVFK